MKYRLRCYTSPSLHYGYEKDVEPDIVDFDEPLFRREEEQLELHSQVQDEVLAEIEREDCQARQESHRV